MNIILGEKQVPIITVVGRTDTIGGARRDIIELWTDEPLTADDVAYIESHDSFTNDMGGSYNNYKEVVRYSTWLAQVDPNAAIVQQVTAEKEALVAEKEALTTAKTTLEAEKTALVETTTALEAEKVALVEEKVVLVEEKEAAVQAKEALQTVTIPTLLRGRTDDVLVQLLDYMPEWTEGNYVIGDVRKHNGQPKICCQAHDSTGNPSWNPTVASLWSPYHAKSAEYALPWITPTGAQDVYKVNEYMIFTDTFTYKCLSDTNYSPSEYAQAWQKIV